MLRREARMDLAQFDATLIDPLEEIMPDHIMNAFMSLTIPVTTYDTWRAQAIKVDEYFRRTKDKRKEEKRRIVYQNCPTTHTS